MVDQNKYSMEKSSSKQNLESTKVIDSEVGWRSSPESEDLKETIDKYLNGSREEQGNSSTLIAEEFEEERNKKFTVPAVRVIDGKHSMQPDEGYEESVFVQRGRAKDVIDDYSSWTESGVYLFAVDLDEVERDEETKRDEVKHIESEDLARLRDEISRSSDTAGVVDDEEARSILEDFGDEVERLYSQHKGDYDADEIGEEEFYMTEGLEMTVYTFPGSVSELRDVIEEYPIKVVSTGSYRD